MADNSNSIAHPPIQKKVISERDGMQTVQLSIAAGASVPTHASNVDVVAVVVKGSGVFTVENRANAIAPGSVIDMRPNQSHSILAHQDLELVVVHARLGAGSAAVHCGAGA